MIERIHLAHGDGGEQAHQLIQSVFVEAFGNHNESKLDSAMLDLSTKKIAFTTDSFVVKPLFFPGGNIGKLAIAGTVNDLAVSGATPLYLTASFIIEEGFLLKDLKLIVQSMAEEAQKANVKIVAGDTKIVERGNADGVYINTTGIGIVEETKQLLPEQIMPGDCIIISGTVGDHGVTILSERGELGLHTTTESDCAVLNGMIESVIRDNNSVRIMRDPTRGGLATTLVELCEDFHFSAMIHEEELPILEEVEGACELLGLDPLYMANEGKVIFIVDNAHKEKVLEVLRNHPLGKNAKCIGEVTSKEGNRLLLKTMLGPTRRLSRLSGVHLPRIC